MSLVNARIEAHLQESIQEHLCKVLIHADWIAEHLPEGVGLRVFIHQASVVDSEGVGAGIHKKIRNVGRVEPFALVSEHGNDHYKARYWCNACMKSFIGEANELPAKCPAGHAEEEAN